MAGKLTLAVATFVATVTLSPTWGQNSTVMNTITGARIGMESDGSTWQTTLFWINAFAGDRNSASITFLDENGNWLQVNCKVPGQTIPFVQINGGPFTNGTQVTGITAVDPKSAAQNFSIQMKSTGGHAISAIVDHLDAAGNILSSSALTDSTLLAPVIATKFAIGLDAGDPNTEESLVLNNSGSTDAHVTLSAFDDGWLKNPRAPFASASITVPAHGRLIGFASRLLGSDANYATFLAGYRASYSEPLYDGFLSVVSDQPIQAGASLIRVLATGTMVQTAWHAFPGVADPNLLAVAGYSTANGYTAGQLTPGQYAVLFGTFAASGNHVTLNGQPVPESAITYQGAGQINVQLGTLVTSGTAVFSVSNPDGTSNALPTTVVPQ
jgi:hypothetical protein